MGTEPITADGEPLLSVEEVARRYCLDPKTVRRHMDDKDLPFMLFGKVRRMCTLADLRVFEQRMRERAQDMVNGRAVEAPIPTGGKGKPKCRSTGPRNRRSGITTSNSEVVDFTALLERHPR